MKTTGLLSLVLALAGAPVSSFAQDPPAADPPLSAEEAQAKALRYYEALVKRPTGGYLFDRFYNAWLDTQTLDELEKYLTKRAEAAEATTGHRLILAFFHARQNASAKALELFAKALEKDPGNAEAWFQKALAESRASNVDQSLKDLEKSLAAKPNKEAAREARQLQGRLLVRAGRTGDAAKVWETLLAENPADEDLHEDLVEIQLTEGQTDDALKTAQGLLEKTKDPYKRVQRRLRVGDIQSRLGNRDAAIAAYSECLADVGSDSWLEREILSQIEQVYRKDDAVAELREKFEALIKTNPQRVALRRGLAKVQTELGEGEAALKTWQELLPLAPGDRSLREAYVQMLADNKKIGEAVTQLQALIAQEPNDPELLIQLAEFHWRADKKDDCLATLRQYLAKADQATETAALRVAAQMERYELKEAALALYAETAKKFASSETALLGHAAALHRADKKDEARAAWRALANGADGPRLSAIARGVAAREEHALAEELLAARLPEFMGDSVFLQFYCETALRSEKEAAAVAPARALLNLAKDTIALDGALANAARVLDRARQTAPVIKELQAAASLTVQEKCLLAELLDKSGDPKKAEAVLREVAQTDAVIGHATLVRVQSARGEFKNAAESQEALVNAPGGRKAVHIQRLVELYEKAGLNEKALGWTAEWRKAAPGSVLVWIRESDLLAASGKPADALRVMRAAAQQFPGDEEIRLRLGEAFRTEGKFADAARIYTMLFEEAKDTTNKVRYAGELAKTAEMGGSMSALLEQFEERRKGNRGSILPLLALAEIHRASGNYEGRRQALLEANRVKQGDPELLMEIARIEESEGKFESALETLQEVKKLDKSGKADDRIIRVLFASGRDQEALQLFFRNAGGEKMDPRMAEEMAVDLTRMGLWEEAASILETITPLHPGDYRLEYLNAVALIELEKTEAASASLLKLLEVKNEMVLPATATAAPTSLQQQRQLLLQQQQQATGMYYYDEYGGRYLADSKLMAKLPSGVPDMIRFRMVATNAKSYQQNRRSNYYNGGGGASIPANLERLRDAVLLQCFVLSQDLTAERKSALWKEVAGRAGLPPELLGPDGVPLEEQDDNALEKLAGAPGANPNLLALLTFNSRVKDPALAVRAWDLFKDTSVQIAWRSLTRLAAEKDDASLRPLREATERVKNWPGLPDLMDLQAIMRCYSAALPKDASPTLLEFARTGVNRFGEWRAALVAGGSDEQRRAAAELGQFQARFLERTDVKALVAFLEEETERAAKDEVKPGLDKVGMSLPRTLIWPLGGAGDLRGKCLYLFPGGGVSSPQSRVYIRTGSGSTSSYSNSAAEPDKDRMALFKEALPLAKHPSVRIMLRLMTDPAAGAEVMEEIKAAPQPTLYYHALRAAWERKNNRVEEAVKILQEAAALPGLTERDKLAVDEFLLTLALELDDDRRNLRYEKVEAVTNAAREAANRLAKVAVLPNDFRSLSGMMIPLGMTVESRQLAARANPARQQQLQARTRLSSYYGSGNAQSQAAQLLEKGRRDLALRIITRELKALSRTATRDTEEDYYLRQWTQLITRFGLEPALKTSFQTSPEEKDAEKLRRSAYVLNALGNTADANALWDKVLELKPDDDAALARVMQIVLKSDLSRAQKMIAALKPAQYGAVGNVLAIALGSDPGYVMDQTAVMKMAVDLMERLKPEDHDKAFVGWVDSAAQNFARSGRLNKGSLPSLFVRPRPKSWNNLNTAAYTKEMDARQELFDRLLAAAVKVPGSARRAACIIAAFRIADGAKEQDQVPLVREAMKLTARGPHAPYPNNNSYSSYGTSSNEVSVPDPEAFLARHAFATGNPKLLDEVDAELKAIAATVKDKETGRVYTGSPEADSLVARYRKLYFGTDKEVIEMLRKTGWPSASMPELFEAMDRRNMEPGLAALITPELRPGSSTGTTNISGVIKLLFKAKPQKEAAEFIEKVAQIYLGAEDKRATLVAGSSYYVRYFLYCFADRGDAAQQFFLTDQYWRHYGRFVPAGRTTTTSSVSNSEWKISGRELFAKQEAKPALETLKVSPFLADLASFNPLPRPGERTLFESCGEVLGKFPKEAKDELIKALQPQAKQLGTALMLTYLHHEKPGAALLDVLAAHEEEFKKLPPERGAEWTWLHTRITTDVKPDGLSGTLKTLLEWLAKFSAPKVETKKPAAGGQMDQFLAAKSFKDINVEYHQLTGWVPGQFNQMLTANPERTAELYKKFRTLMAVLAKSNTSGNMSYYFEYPLEELGRQRAEKPHADPAVQLKELRGMFDAWQAPEGYPLPFDLLASFVPSRFEAAARGPDVDGKKQPLRLELLLPALKENFEPEQALLLLPWVQVIAEKMAVHDKPEVKAAMEKLVATAPDDWTHKLLASAVAMRLHRHVPWQQRDADIKAAREARAAAKKEKKTAEEIAAMPDPLVIGRRAVHSGIADRAKLPAYQEALYAFSEDRNVNVNVRSGVLMEALRRDEGSEPALLVAAMRTLAESWRAGCLMNDQSLSTIASRLTLWLNQPGVTAMPELKTVMREAVGAWRAALRKPNARTRNVRGYPAAALLDLAIMLNDDETISGILSAVPEQLSARWVVRLLGAGKTEAAARVVLNGKDALLADSYYLSYENTLADKSRWTCSADIQAKAPAFIESMQSPAYRAFAAALLANFPDAPGLTPRDERMVAAAKLLPPPAAGASGDVNARTVALLAGNDAARRSVAPQIAEAVKDITLSMLPDAQDRTLAARRRMLLEAHLANCAVAGNFEYVKKEITGLVKLRSENNEYEQARMLGGVAGKLIAATNGALGQMSEEVRAANRAMWTELVFGPEWYGSYASMSYSELYSASGRLFHAVLLYAYDDKMDEWRALYAKQSEEVRSRLMDRWRQMDLGDAYKNIPSWPWSKNEDELLKERSRLTVRLIQSKLGFPGFNRGSGATWLRDRIKQKLVRREDLYPLADLFRQRSNMVSAHCGLPAIEFADFFREDGNREKAVEWIKAATPLLDTGATILYCENLLGQASVYRRMNMKPEALAALQSAGKDLLEHPDFKGGMRSSYERALDELDTEILMAAGAEKAVAGMQERLKAAPDDAKVWNKFATVAETLGKQAMTDKKWAEAADWHLLGSAAVSRLGAKDKDRADAGRALWNVEQIALALAQSGVAAPDYMAVIPRGARWRYLDDGAVPPSGWHDLKFDDSKWPEGPAPLGYGDPDMGTETKPGGEDASNHAITTVMRHSFEVKDPAALQSLELHYRVDDGCVVYLNGAEILRRNLPENQEIDHTTRALKATSAEDETRYHTLAKVDAALLKPGANFLAVEVHQDKPTSTDLVFDASLSANIRPLEEVYADSWKRPMSPSVGTFWQNLPESFRTALQKTPEPEPTPELAPAPVPAKK